MIAIFEALRTMPLPTAALWIVLENTAIFVASIILGHLLVRAFRAHPIAEAPTPIVTEEILLTLSTILLNSLITLIGLILWRANVIQIAYTVSIPRAILDTLVLFFAMDFLMYLFHRVAHIPPLFRLLHATHHKYENPRPLTLFVLNPIECLGFGALWLVVITVYPASMAAILIYLTLNVASGLMGHLGVEPFPALWTRLPGIALVSTSTFHAEHHADSVHNFGFYTLIWDRLFGTISPDYTADFARTQSPRDRTQPGGKVGNN